jgi:hypothetical protein
MALGSWSRASEDKQSNGCSVEVARGREGRNREKKFSAQRTRILN